MNRTSAPIRHPLGRDEAMGGTRESAGPGRASTGRFGMRALIRAARRSPWRTIVPGVALLTALGVGYHDPTVENLPNALLGIHRGLSRRALPAHYQGVAIYCDWETDPAEWEYWTMHFLRP